MYVHVSIVGEEMSYVDEVKYNMLKNSLEGVAVTLPPEAGHWFDYQIKQLAANAVFKDTLPVRQLRS